MENPNIVYGRLSESVHISGYSLERAMGELEWLLDDNRWKKVGAGYSDINDFLKTISFKEFKIAIQQRKELAKRLTELEASQRATAKMLGVSADTINKDINVRNRTPKENIISDNQDIIIDNVRNRTLPETSRKSWIEKSGQDIIKEEKQEAKKEEKKEERKKEKQKQAEEGNKITITNDDINIFNGDFSRVLDYIPNNSLNIIITDPPYPHEFIECWSNLSLFAAKKLKINGFCIAYSGQTNLIEVMNRMSENLIYYWTFALIHSGNKQLINHRNIFCGWKPLLIFQNQLKKKGDVCEDIILGSGLEKDYHNWQQGEAELAPIIEHFTKPGDIICDPFLGGGTTAIASLKLKRKFIGAEINEQQFNIAKKRIYEQR